ncbi:hypothetical protein VHEMI03408 [[Torrubiella] hemipterigena]|uniref:ATP synthase F0 n=1 Tax=[Torrubiella] hemipterigena TaxID=1531966 RepID=A0A0A1SYE1_9HYPO|nr:hypothetical protein VHEMI03408 [[Torrubiella] hemipterigena]
MVNWNNLNPFSRRETYSVGEITGYKVLTLATWLLSVVSSVYYTLEKPHVGHHNGHRIWEQNDLHVSAFTMNSIIASIFWVTLFVLQFGYITRLFSSNTETTHAASSVGSHFIVNNLLHFGFVWLFVRSRFAWAEVLLIINFVNLSALYFRHNTYPRFIHAPVVSGPLAWTFVAIYWNGAIMVPKQDTLVLRILANVFIWSILAYGSFFLAIYNDYTMGLSLSVLSAAIGVAQFQRQIVAFQWIFAFIIMGLLFLGTLGVAVPVWTGRELKWKTRAPAADAERAPLLNDE